MTTRGLDRPLDQATSFAHGASRDDIYGIADGPGPGEYDVGVSSIDTTRGTSLGLGERPEMAPGKPAPLYLIIDLREFPATPSAPFTDT